MYITMYNVIGAAAEGGVVTTWTMSEARQRFRELLDRASSGQPVQITRYGEVAAVIIAREDFERLQQTAEEFPAALRRFRATIEAEDLFDDELDGLRDRGSGRPVTL
jgi:prevent-host-death family protein